MNRLAIISSFLGACKNRYMTYQGDRGLEEKFEMASQIEGVEGLELAYPRDFADIQQLKIFLNEYGFAVPAINFRSRRTGKWWRGSFSAESTVEREEVMDDLKRAMDLAAELGCYRITTCPLNDGTDYPFEMDYARAYDYTAQSFSEICAHNPAVKICIEYKRSDPRARCLFGTAGETAAFCQIVDAHNLGVTLDIGHALYGGERPAQSTALLARAGRLFYVHLNDNDGRWDWDMIPGAYHLWEFVEFFYTLRKVGYDDDWYSFDVFPKEIDTVANFNAVTQMTRKLEGITERIDEDKMEEMMKARDPSRIVPYLYSLI
ncbi:MAG: sugar phosphate isomerase/epimerase family protein [Anaerolineales bacterium]